LEIEVLSFYLSVTLVICDETKEYTANILIPCKKRHHSSFLITTEVGG